MVVMMVLELINWHLALDQDYLGLNASNPEVALVSKKL